MTVFANGMEISAKAQGCKIVAAFPDVCFTPPQTPATPPGVPIPYPNFGFDSDLTSASTTVKIGGKPVSIENKSHYSKCSGDEAGCAPKKGVVTSKNTGKIYAQAWSSDVKVEGKGVVRFGDLATSNHGSNTGDTPPWVKVGQMSVDGNSCAKIVAQFHEYSDNDCKKPKQSHHVVDNASFTMTGARKVALKNIDAPADGRQKRNLFQPVGKKQHPGVGYDENKAPCICLKGGKSDPKAEHGIAHDVTESAAATQATPDGKWTYAQSRDAGVASIKKAKKLTDWEAECVKMVLDAYYKDELGCTDSTEIAAPPGQSSASHFDDGKGNMINAYELV